jgi:hypothetical protein
MKPGIPSKIAWWQRAAIAGGLVLTVVACGSGGTSSAPSSPSPAAAASPTNSVLCASAAALHASLTKLTHVKVGKGTVDEIKADLTDVQAKLTAFVTDARGQWQAQTSALKSALAKLQTAVKNLTASPSTSALAGVATALGGVTAAGQSLLAAVDTRCPSASPAPSG